MQRYFIKEKQDNYFILEKEDIHHTRNVMRNQVGDSIECIYQEKLYIGKIENIDQGRVKIIEESKENHEMEREITIAIGLVKEQKMDLILQKLTELGVSRIIPLKMERSIIKLEKEKIKKKKERWEKICKEAAEQSKRNKIPEIVEPISLKELQNLRFDKKYICSTTNTQILNYNYLQENPKYATMIFVIGPEGGISEKEEDFLENIGYTKISLGSRILRVETAAIYIASIMNFVE